MVCDVIQWPLLQHRRFHQVPATCAFRRNVVAFAEHSRQKAREADWIKVVNLSRQPVSQSRI